MPHPIPITYTKHSLNSNYQNNINIKHKGGDKLTLNLTGTTTPLIIHNTTTCALSPTSTTKNSYPLPATSDSNTIFNASSFSNAPLSSSNPTTPIDVQQSKSLLNGGQPMTPAAAEHVTVTHFSEQRGAMEKISVPSVNIFNAEIKTPKVDNIHSERNLRASDTNEIKKQTNNPFLNMSPMTPPQSPPAQMPSISSTNPFKSSPSNVIVSNATSATYPSVINPNSNPFADAEIISNKSLDRQANDVIVQKIEQNIHEYEKKVSCLLFCIDLHAFCCFVYINSF